MIGWLFILGFFFYPDPQCNDQVPWGTKDAIVLLSLSVVVVVVVVVVNDVVIVVVVVGGCGGFPTL